MSVVRSLAGLAEVGPHTREVRLERLFEDFGLGSMRLVAAAMRRAPGLEVLHLARCFVGGVEGVHVLGEALEAVPELRSLRVDMGAVDDDGMQVLAEAITHTPSLRVLSLAENCTSDRGVMAVARSLATSPPRALQLLDLAGSEACVTEQAVLALHACVKAVPELAGLRVNVDGGSDARELTKEEATVLLHRLGWTSVGEKVVLLLLGMRVGAPGGRGGSSSSSSSSSSLTRLGGHVLLDVNVLLLVRCFLSGEDSRVMQQLEEVYLSRD